MSSSAHEGSSAGPGWRTRPRPCRGLRGLRIVVLSSLLGFVACASSPRVMHLTDPSLSPVERVWPQPPETARYRYLGMLTGEANFGPERPAELSPAIRLLRWLVGLGIGGDDPDVLLRPQSGAVDDVRGRIFVTDAARQAVFVFDESLAGLEIWQRADDGSRFDTPVGIAIAPDGSVFVADAGLGRVVVLDGDGRPRGSIGEERLIRPTGLALDRLTGELYVADTARHVIEVFDRSGRSVRQLGRRGSDIGEFNAPTHLALARDRLYVSDTLNARVQVISQAGEPARVIGTRGLHVGNLTRAKGVAVDREDNVYIVESYFDHLLVFDRSGRFLLPIGGSGNEIGHFYLPAGVWSDSRDRIYVADMFNGRVIVMQYLGSG